MRMEFYYSFKYTVLLVSLVAVLSGRMAAAAYPESRLPLATCSAIVVLSALLTVINHRKYRVAAIILAVPAMMGTFGGGGGTGKAFEYSAVVGQLFGIVFLSFTVGIILRDLIRHRDVNFDSLVGTFCGYVLIGAIWSEMYFFLEYIHPGTLHFAQLNPRDTFETAPDRWLLIQYFSFTTLSTLGYGDISPVSPIARTLACLEAICGQFYLAVLVAGLVSVRASTFLSNDDAPPRGSA